MSIPTAAITATASAEPEPAILVVDPDPTSRAALCEIVAPLAHVAVGSGEAAVEAIARREFAAALIDLELPDTDGVELVTQLRRDAHGRNVPVLFVSHAPPDWLTERRGYALGALGYLTKPVDAVALRARLEVLVTLFQRGVELRRHERLISEQHAALEEATAANRSKDLHLGVLGHDLRSPLGAILMCARTMLMQPALRDEDRRSWTRVARNGERMAALIRDIIDYARGHAHGALPIVPRPTDMGDVCSAMLDEIGLLYGDRKIRLETRGELRGRWDRERVEQVVSNLVTNALNHGRGDVALTVDGQPAEVVVVVRNGGAPIPPAELPKLFEPFHRGGRSAGLGLGLYIVREIVRAHGGSIDVSSTAADGTTFTTRWPRAGTSQPQGTP